SGKMRPKVTSRLGASKAGARCHQPSSRCLLRVSLTRIVGGITLKRTMARRVGDRSERGLKMPTTSSASRNFPTLRYLAAPCRWLLGGGGGGGTVAAVLLAMIAALPLWWSIQLLGLPDIGEPFDPEAFRSFRIPDDRNAFVLYRQAAAALKPLKSS